MVAVRAEDHYLESHLKQFADQGYTVVRGVFSPDEVSVMLAASERVIGKVRADPMSFDPPTVPRFTSRAVGELDTWGVDNMFAPRLYDPASPDRHPDGGRGQSERGRGAGERGTDRDGGEGPAQAGVIDQVCPFLFKNPRHGTAESVGLRMLEDYVGSVAVD